jgi:Tfp pilus assembly protein FimT
MESLVIVAMVGILAAIAAPSFLGWLTQYRVNQAAIQVKTALEISQQEAIRRSRICTLNVPNGAQVSGDCLVTGAVTFEPGVELKSNLLSPEVRFGLRGNTTDSGTILIYANGSQARAKCIVTSVGIGMIRTGDYVGDISNFNPTQCQASS